MPTDMCKFNIFHKQMMRNSFLTLILFVFVSSTGAINIKAQDFEVAPVLISFDANPGETQNRKLTVRNHSNERQRYLLALADYSTDRNGTRQSLDAGSTERSVAGFLTINPAFIELNPNETAEVDVNISIPPGMFKTCWGMVLVEVAREQTPFDADKQLATGILIMPRIVVLVKQSSRANRNFSGTVSGLHEVTEPGSVSRTFEATLKNTGDKILEAKVFLALANLDTAEEQTFPPTRITVYPDQERVVRLTLPVNPTRGSYALALLMDYGNRSALEGAQILLEVN